jgi:hypothetical protein
VTEAHARHDEEHEPPDMAGRRLRRIRRRFRRGPSSEERLAQFVEERRREFDAQTARFEQTLADLERRERLLSDARASVERLLRLGSKDLDVREADITRVMEELTDREASIREQESELAERRSQLGAVELKRLAVEQREQALEAREARVAEAEERVAEHGVSPMALDPPTLALVPGARYRLVEIDPTEPGGPVVVDGDAYDVLRTGPSPLPGDGRRCAYLAPGPLEPDPGGGSS